MKRLNLEKIIEQRFVIFSYNGNAKITIIFNPTNIYPPTVGAAVMRIESAGNYIEYDVQQRQPKIDYLLNDKNYENGNSFDETIYSYFVYDDCWAYFKRDGFIILMSHDDQVRVSFSSTGEYIDSDGI